MKNTGASLLIVVALSFAGSASGANLTLYEEDFEGGLGNFAVNGLWHTTIECLSALTGHSEATSLYYGQDDSCNYDNGLANSGIATSPEITVDNVTSPQLTFNYYLSTEGAPDDQATVEVSYQNQPYVLVAGNGVGQGVLLSDGSGSWESASIDLSSLIQAQPAALRVRFRFVATPSS